MTWDYRRGDTMRLRREDAGLNRVIKLEDGRALKLVRRIEGGLGRLGEDTVQFTSLEFGLLDQLVERHTKYRDSELAFMSWQQLSGALAFKSRAADSENVRELVRRVRRKLKKVGISGLIESRQRVGYRLHASATVVG